MAPFGIRAEQNLEAILLRKGRKYRVSTDEEDHHQKIDFWIWLQQYQKWCKTQLTVATDIDIVRRKIAECQAHHVAYLQLSARELRIGAMSDKKVSIQARDRIVHKLTTTLQAALLADPLVGISDEDFKNLRREA